MVSTPKPNGFADHYPVFKWLFHWEYILFSDKPIESSNILLIISVRLLSCAWQLLHGGYTTSSHKHPTDSHRLQEEKVGMSWAFALFDIFWHLVKPKALYTVQRNWQQQRLLWTQTGEQKLTSSFLFKHKFLELLCQTENPKSVVTTFCLLFLMNSHEFSTRNTSAPFVYKDWRSWTFLTSATRARKLLDRSSEPMLLSCIKWYRPVAGKEQTNWT